MNLLLDTHILLWWLADEPMLSQKARQAISLKKNTVFVSAASAWEISIKKTLGKLIAPDDLLHVITFNEFQSLPINLAHAEAAGSLPRHHEDPFDRMLIAQADIEKLTLVTHDKRFKSYQAPLMLV